MKNTNRIIVLTLLSSLGCFSFVFCPKSSDDERAHSKPITSSILQSPVRIASTRISKKSSDYATRGDSEGQSGETGRQLQMPHARESRHEFFDKTSAELNDALVRQRKVATGDKLTAEEKKAEKIAPTSPALQLNSINPEAKATEPVKTEASKIISKEVPEEKSKKLEARQSNSGSLETLENKREQETKSRIKEVHELPNHNEALKDKETTQEKKKGWSKTKKAVVFGGGGLAVGAAALAGLIAVQHLDRPTGIQSDGTGSSASVDAQKNDTDGTLTGIQSGDAGDEVPQNSVEPGDFIAAPIE